MSLSSSQEQRWFILLFRREEQLKGQPPRIYYRRKLIKDLKKEKRALHPCSEVRIRGSDHLSMSFLWRLRTCAFISVPFLCRSMLPRLPKTTHRKEPDSWPVLRHVHESPRAGLNACVPLAERPRGDQRVAGRSSQRGGYPLLQPFPGPEPGAPHAADHDHPQHLLLQTLSHNGNDSARKLWKLEILSVDFLWNCRWCLLRALDLKRDLFFNVLKVRSGVNQLFPDMKTSLKWICVKITSNLYNI